MAVPSSGPLVIVNIVQLTVDGRRRCGRARHDLNVRVVRAFFLHDFAFDFEPANVASCDHLKTP